MTTLILTVHLLLAATYTFSIVGITVAAALKKAASTAKYFTLSSFAGTVVSGVVLVFASPKSMEQFCASTLVASAFGIMAWAFYKKRVLALQPQQSKIY